MSQSDNDEQSVVSEIYKAAAKPEPSEVLDAKVLNMAKQQSSSKNVKSSQIQNASKSNRTPFYMKWQYSGSIAASVLIIGFLFVSHSPEEFDAIPRNTMQDELPLAEPQQIRMRDADKMTRELQTQNLERADKFNELASDAMNASKMRLEAAPANQKEIAALQAEAAFILTALHESDHKSKLASEGLKDLSELSENVQGISRQRDEQTQASLQQQLFNTLKALKEKEPNWALDDSFKAVLSAEQIEDLVAISAHK
jgi:hypothetical protein